MTALAEYQRLECVGLWRPDASAQRREVIVSLGDATLTLSDPKSQQPLAHWSLPAVRRINPRQMPALYRPGEDATEDLELADETLVRAIAKVHDLVDARRRHPGRLRGALALGIAAALLAGLGFWLPGALIDHAAAILPPAKRIETGGRVLDELTRVAGPSCGAGPGLAALDQLEQRLGGGVRIVVLPEAPPRAIALPGNLVVVGLPLIAGHDSPDIMAGAILAAQAVTQSDDPMRAALRWAGPGAVFRLLTTGRLPEPALAGYGASLIAAPGPAPDPEALRNRFESLGLDASGYAASLGAADPLAVGLAEDRVSGARPVTPALTDDAWVALQGICD